MAQRAAPERDSRRRGPRGRGPRAAAARAVPAASQTDRLAWLALRSARKGRRRWTAAEVADLHAMVGRVLPQEMARRLERPLNTVLCKLHALGYRVSVDVMEPLGLTAIALARRLDIPYHVLWWEVRAGKVPARKIGYKTFLIKWADARAFERRLGRIRRKRERALARITEPTLTKAELMKLLRIGETQATRYLQCAIVKGYKLPCAWTSAPRRRWEWLVSAADARRVKRLRETGQLRLNSKAYREMVADQTREIARLRREGRLGRRAELRHSFAPLVAGRHTVTRVVQMSGISEQVVRAEIRTGLLRASRVKIGRQMRILVTPGAYRAWLRRRKAGRQARAARGRARGRTRGTAPLGSVRVKGARS